LSIHGTGLLGSGQVAATGDDSIVMMSTAAASSAINRLIFAPLWLIIVITYLRDPIAWSRNHRGSDLLWATGLSLIALVIYILHLRVRKTTGGFDLQTVTLSALGGLRMTSIKTTGALIYNPLFRQISIKNIFLSRKKLSQISFMVLSNA
jgi:hypothetical protein